MTTEEKLQKFLETSMEDARSRSMALFHEYKDALDQMYEQHVENETAQAQLRLKLEAQRFERDMNKELSKEQIMIRQRMSRRVADLEDKLFVEVENLLAEFMETPDYEAYLIEKIKEARDFAAGQELIAYIDPADEERRRGLEIASGIRLTVSEYSFRGGIRAVIPSKHILIDNSFAAKLAEARENFTLDGGRLHA